MDHENIEELEYFFQCYFHQDWRDDYSSPEKAVQDFIKNEHESKVKRLQNALVALNESGQINKDTIYSFGGYYVPELTGGSTATWINEVVEQLNNEEKEMKK